MHRQSQSEEMKMICNHRISQRLAGSAILALTAFALVTAPVRFGMTGVFSQAALADSSKPDSIDPTSDGSGKDRVSTNPQVSSNDSIDRSSGNDSVDHSADGSNDHGNGQTGASGNAGTNGSSAGEHSGGNGSGGQEGGDR
jgi:hypothetical protein